MNMDDDATINGNDQTPQESQASPLANQASPLANAEPQTMPEVPPSPNRSNRDASGRFLKGCRGGPGNPEAKRIAAMRRAIREAVSLDQLRQIAQALVDKAVGGDVTACRELLDRLIGRSAGYVDLELESRIRTLEERLQG